jgi:membrane protease YdiL (CAAX protease family)
MRARRPASHLLGIVVFFGVTFVLTMASLALVSRVTAGPPTTIWRATLGYVLVLGWQPFAAVWIVRRTVDELPSGHVHRVAPRSYVRLGIALPLVLLASAVLVQAALGPVFAGHLAPRAQATASTIAGFAGAVAILWMQAFVEETTWRGYLLPRLMQALGPWPGLCVHGLLWGACYAPVFSWGAPADPARLLAFVVTLGLLGTVLGWLRLASGSLAPSATCNATLTIGAGLPLVLQGTSPALAAVFEPAGWLPMLLFIATIATRPGLREAVIVRSP